MDSDFYFLGLSNFVDTVALVWIFFSDSEKFLLDNGNVSVTFEVFPAFLLFLSQKASMHELQLSK